MRSHHATGSQRTDQHRQELYIPRAQTRIAAGINRDVVVRAIAMHDQLERACVKREWAHTQSPISISIVEIYICDIMMLISPALQRRDCFSQNIANGFVNGHSNFCDSPRRGP